MFSPAVLVKHSTACFLFDICWCAYLMNKARLEQSYAEGWPQSGTYGKGCTARNSSRHVGVFNGEWSNLRFLMMIRGGNWLRFTVSLTAETEEGENRIKASKLSVCGYAGLFVCAQVWDRKRERERPMTYNWPHHRTPVHPHTSTPPLPEEMYHLNQLQLSSQNLMNLDSILRLAALHTDTHSHSLSHTHTLKYWGSLTYSWVVVFVT